MRLSDESLFLQREIIDRIRKSDEKMEAYLKKADEKMDKFDRKMENCWKKTDEKVDTFLRTIADTVGTQLHGMNSTIVKMKEEEDDRYRQINEKTRILKRKYENRQEEPRGTHVDRNQGKAVITGFHNETSESEVIQLLEQSITEIGMTIENTRVECAAKPITHVFIHFKNDDERNKYVRSAVKNYEEQR